MQQDPARRGRPRQQRPPRAAEFPRKRPALSSGPGDLQGMAQPPYTQRDKRCPAETSCTAPRRGPLPVRGTGRQG
eukprot:11045292-Alexandrium_andersonii.AAC.1